MTTRNRKQAKTARAGDKDPREAILDTAEQLIGQRGVAGVSLREISLASGTANHSAVHYYFKNKDGLIKALINKRADAIDERRKNLLGKLVKRGFEQDSRALMAAILLPIAEERNADGECAYAAFLLALRVFNDISQWRIMADSPVITLNLYEMLKASLKPLPEEIVDMRFLAAFTLFLVSVVDWDQSRIFSQQLMPSREAYLEACIDFASAGMQADYQASG